MHIPNPCYEDWSQMTPVEHGRVCASCNSLVADFTKLTNDEILNLISTGNIHCGRFYEDQLLLPEIKRGWLSDWFGKFSKDWMFVSLLTLLEISTPFELSAKTIQVEHIEEARNEFPGDSGVIMPGFIQGTVVRRHSSGPAYAVIDRKIFIYNQKGKKIGEAITDKSGVFTFALPESNAEQYYTLVLKGFKKRTRYKVYHYHKVECTWSPGQPWIELQENCTVKRKLFAPKPVITGRFR